MTDVRERMIQRKIMRNNSGEHTRSACWFWRPAKTNFEDIVLLRVNRILSDGSHKSGASPLPMKHLAGIERLLEIEIRCVNFNGAHEQTSNAQRSTSNIELQKNCFAA